MHHAGHMSLRAVLRGVALLGLTAVAILFGRALPMLSAFLVLVVAFTLIARWTLDREFLEERFRRHQTGEDPRRLALIRVLALALFLIALLDIVRFHWSDSVPRALQVAALGLVAAACALILWAMTVNRFFVPVIRVQPERGHQVVSAGPYARVRHPGYAGMALFGPASALALGSWWALLPGALLASLFVARAAHEDRYLLASLEGYAGYAARVPWRLLPGVW